ncbi:putative manganese transporter [Halalkalicoccus sp. NIPERK01]|uniref:putative manganese transporter n=1 Tax=Halalkalicoccus sp. NIPERK01 TaxID=3053469 RepID=UPI00256F025F|nr:putative manganese transporter [Halalkalicoccus sp. NIPERK01]MDL5362645.1 putative manganese transporter [Halalkalicoccus sp. NIPERK01]
MAELFDILVASIRDGFVQVSAFVAITVVVFSYLQYRTGGRLVERLERNERWQPLVGAFLGLTPGCGGAIVVMPLYIRGSVGFGTVVATLIATAGDAAFVILVLAPGAALYAYGIAFVTAVVSGYAIDRFGLGVGRVDRAVARLRPTVTDGGTMASANPAANPGHEYGIGACGHDHGDERETGFMTWLSHAVHVAWWLTALVALAAGTAYLLRGAPDVAMTVAPTFEGAFTVAGIVGSVLSVYLYAVGRRYIGGGHVGHVRESFHSAYDTFQHAAMETSFVTVWVIGGYLLYEYTVVLGNVDVAALAAAAGLLAPVGGAVIGLIPGCGPQIVLAGVYAEGAIPFSALVSNAISQDGDALFPLIAMDKTAAIVASIYTTIPALVVGIALHALFGPMFGFGVL